MTNKKLALDPLALRNYLSVILPFSDNYSSNVTLDEKCYIRQNLNSLIYQGFKDTFLYFSNTIAFICNVLYNIVKKHYIRWR